MKNTTTQCRDGACPVSPEKKHPFTSLVRRGRPRLYTVALFLLLPLLTFGQDWSAVQKALDNRQFATADKQASALFAKARKNRDAHQMLVGAFYLSQIEHAYKEDPEDSTLARYQWLLPQLKGADRPMCLALMDSLPQALRDSLVLQQTPAEEYSEFLAPQPPKGGVDLALAPTLFDVLAWERIPRAQQEEREFLIASLRHLHRDDPCLLVEIELAYAQHLSRYDLESHYINAIARLGGTFDKPTHALCDHYTLLYYRLAEHLRSLGEERYLDALAHCGAPALAPKSEGALRSQRLEEELLAPEINLYSCGNEQMAERHMLALAQVRNVQKLHFRLCSGEGITGKEESVLKAKVLKEWTQETGVPKADPTTHALYCYLPPMPAGKYVLLASHDGRFAKDHVVWLSLDLTDLVILPVESTSARPEGYLLHRASGQPIADQEVTLYIATDRDQYLDICTTRTDRDGHYSFATHEQEIAKLMKQYKRSPNPKVFYQGRWHGDKQTTYAYGYNGNATEVYPDGKIYLDQPVYKPGDTVRFSFLLYQGDRRTFNAPIIGERLTAYLYSDRHELLDSLPLVLDSFGTAQGLFRLPSEEGIGNCYIEAYDRYGKQLSGAVWVHMEHYKQPKFEVLLDENRTEPAFGMPYRVEGTAAAYSGAPIDGAEVRWTVFRQELYPWWRWREGKAPLCVAEGTLRTDQEGRFSFDFIPTPDSTVELRNHPNFHYQIRVTVTDLNGETHEAEQGFLLGFDSGELRLDDERLTFQSLDGKPLEGDIRLRIEELEPVAPRIQPTFDAWRLRRATLDTLRHTLTPEAFAARFPLYPYEKEDSRVRALVKDSTVTLVPRVETLRYRALFPLGTGRYRVSASTIGRLGDTIRAEHTLLVGQSDGLLYMKYDKGYLTLDSRFDSMEVRLLVSVRDSVLSCQRLVLNHETRRIPIAITPEMKGGFRIQALAWKENTLLSLMEEVPVPYEEKQLSLTLTTFRNRLAPGSEEQWTLHVSDWKNNPVRAAALMTMYDAALDTYGRLNWHLSPWHDNHNRTVFRQPSMGSDNSLGRLYRLPDLRLTTWQATRWSLNRPGRYYNYSNRMLYAAKASGTARGEDGVVVTEDAEYEEEVTVACVIDAASSVETGLAPVSNPDGTDDDETGTRPVSTRSDFRTLAFFHPTLRTDAEGNADITFRVPDLLTRWSIHGLAWTQDMRCGSLTEQAVTQKELMLQVNKPRFLRLGDSVMLSAKITNMTDEVLSARVSLCVETRPASSQPKDVILRGDGAGPVSTLEVVIPAHGSTAVSFPLRADSLGLITYTLTATTPHHSDGERDAIAVLPTRMRVTESMAMYINGSGEKDYTFDHLLHSDTSSTLQHDSLSLEWVNNPISLAIAAFPHLKEQENPSNIYRFNAYYCGRLYQRIVETGRVPVPETGRVPVSHPNGTVIAETGTRPVSTVEEDLQKLLSAQRPDGSWSWIPGGEYSSLWTTTYILTGLGRLGEENQAALKYVDNEEYQFYQKYHKRSKFRCEPDNISYLYMRTFFGKPSGKMKEMYDFYYANAKKHALSYTGLYTRAQLVLLFHRTGEKKLARQLVDQLKECALYSDEMGMYWRDNLSGLFWTDRPIEVQALLIEAFRTVTPQDTESVALMQQWLLKQKQTTKWESDVATANAIASLLRGNKEEGIGNEIGNKEEGIRNKASVSISFPDAGLTLTDTSLSPNPYSLFPNPYSLFSRTHIMRSGKGPAWGAMYWSYYEEMEKIPSSEMGIKLKRTLYRVNPDGSLTEATTFRVGDRMRVRIDIQCDRTLDQLELRDPRAASCEPLSTANGWHWNMGLSYYNYISNDATLLYIDRLQKGKYQVEYDLHLTAAGHFSLPPTELKSLYAPAFRALAPATTLTVQPQ